MTLSNGKTSAYQWDIGLTVPTTDAEGTVRRFTNEHSARSIPVACAEDADGNMVYAIPNILLTTGRPIIMFTLAGDNDGIIYTDTQEYLPVFPAPKPDDYIFTDAEINLWKSLCDRMDTAESNISTNTTNIGLNTAAIAANALAIGTNANNITTLQGAMSTAQSDITNIKNSPHVYIFPLEENGGVLSTTATFAEVTAAFQRGDIVKTYLGAYVLTMMIAEYTDPPDEDLYMLFSAPWPTDDGATILGQGYLSCELVSGTWTFDSWGDTLPQWLAPDITDSSNYGKVPVITSLGVEWQMPSDDIPAPAAPSDGDVLTYDSNAGEWIAAAPGGGGSSDIYLITLDQYSMPTNAVSDIEDAIDAGKLLVIVKDESNGDTAFSYVEIYKGEYDATTLDLYLTAYSEHDAITTKAWHAQYTYTYASTSWSLTDSDTYHYTIPTGGTTGQALVKNSNSTGDTKWKSLAASDVGAIASPATPTNGDVLTYNGANWVAQAPGGGSTEIYYINLDSNLEPTNTASDILAAFNAGKVLITTRTTNDDTTYYGYVVNLQDLSGGEYIFEYLEAMNNGSKLRLTLRGLIWDGAAWDDGASDQVNLRASSSTPANLGTAAVGSSTDYARADHVHNMPSASDVGAIAAPVSATTGQVLTWSGSAWVAQSLPVYDGS